MEVLILISILLVGASLMYGAFLSRINWWQINKNKKGGALAYAIPLCFIGIIFLTAVYRQSLSGWEPVPILFLVFFASQFVILRQIS
ncbi:MAG TPA: hypothetical protein PLD54_03890 [Candidatus Levybacteria bacterium]|nr:hypothetical protein [Candidatus Levybacteria bacterium]